MSKAFYLDYSFNLFRGDEKNAAEVCSYIMASFGEIPRIL
jgi:hypothetical protein